MGGLVRSAEHEQIIPVPPPVLGTAKMRIKAKPLPAAELVLLCDELLCH